MADRMFAILPQGGLRLRAAFFPPTAEPVGIQKVTTMKSDDVPDPHCNFVGNDGFYHTITGQPFNGRVLALAPWAANDPILNNPAHSLAERRSTCLSIALASIGKSDNFRFFQVCIAN